MDQQTDQYTENEPYENSKNTKTIWIAAVAVIITTLITGGGVYAWQNSSNKSIEQNLQQQITLLQNQISELKEAQKTQETTTQETTIKETNTPVANTNSDWKLVSGFVDDTCSGPTFEGNVNIRGWYSYIKEGEEIYISGWMFNVVSEDIAKLPLDKIAAKNSMFNKRLKIVDVTPDLEEKLKKATEQNPVSVALKGYITYCEGAPLVSINGVEALK